MSRHLILAAAFLVVALVPSDAFAASPPSVWVTIPPQRWVVEQIAGDLVEVHVLVQPGQSHHTFEPGPKQLAALAEADLYLRLGASSEDLLMRRLNEVTSRPEAVDCSRGVKLVPMSETVSGDVHGHDAGLPDPHYWLDPSLLAIHAGNAYDALSRLLPGHAEELKARLDTLRAVLETTDRQVAVRLEPWAGRSILVYHPAFGYFTRRYGLLQVSVEVEGKEPTARQLAGLVELAERLGVRSVFLQPQFSGRAPQALAEAIGGTVVHLDPLAEDYPTNLEAMASRIVDSFGK